MKVQLLKPMNKAFIVIIMLLMMNQGVFAQFPCGTQQLNNCNCQQTGILVADSDPCTFNSGESQTFLLVDTENAIISTDADDGVIVNTSNSGVFYNVEQGDYVTYSLVYNTSDQPIIQALTSYFNPIAAIQSLGTESPSGTWTSSSSPSFTLTASPLATVNGPECDCPTYSCGNYFWIDLNFNGTPEPNEPGIPGIIVWLFLDVDGDGIPDLAPGTSVNRSVADPIATTVSNESGHYYFDNLPAGQYVMQIDLTSLPTIAPNGTPVTYAPTVQDVGSEFRDSDFDSEGFGPSFTLDDNETNLNFDAGFRTTMITLATELLTFDGEATEKGNELVWATASEEDNDYFNIMYSQNGTEFQSVGTVESKGNSTARQNYNFLDNDAPIGTGYYRLTSTDFSGKTAIISKTISLTKERQNLELIKFYPTLATDFVNIEFMGNKESQVDIKVFNLSGQVLFNQSQQTVEGHNKMELDVQSYPVGVYMFTITDGEDTIIGKFIRQ